MSAREDNLTFHHRPVLCLSDPRPCSILSHGDVTLLYFFCFVSGTKLHPLTTCFILNFLSRYYVVAQRHSVYL